MGNFVKGWFLVEKKCMGYLNSFVKKVRIIFYGEKVLFVIECIERFVILKVI